MRGRRRGNRRGACGDGNNGFIVRWWCLKVFRHNRTILEWYKTGSLIKCFHLFRRKRRPHITLSVRLSDTVSAYCSSEHLLKLPFELGLRARQDPGMSSLLAGFGIDQTRRLTAGLLREIPIVRKTLKPKTLKQVLHKNLRKKRG